MEPEFSFPINAELWFHRLRAALQRCEDGRIQCCSKGSMPEHGTLPPYCVATATALWAVSAQKQQRMRLDKGPPCKSEHRNPSCKCISKHGVLITVQHCSFRFQIPEEDKMRKWTSVFPGLDILTFALWSLGHRHSEAYNVRCRATCNIKPSAP